MLKHAGLSWGVEAGLVVLGPKAAGECLKESRSFGGAPA